MNHRRRGFSGRLSYVAGALQQFHTRASQAWAVAQNLRYNLLTESEFRNGLTDVATRIGLVTLAAFPGFANGLAFGYDGATTSAAYKSYTPTAGLTYTVSVFVQMTDNAAPVFANGAPTNVANDFCLVAHGAAIDPTTYTVANLGNGLYRVTASLLATGGVNVGVVKYNTNSTRTFKVTGYQFEEGATSAGYVATTAAAVPKYELRTYANNVLRVLPSPAGIMAALREPQSTNYYPNTTTIPGSGDPGTALATGIATGFDGNASVCRLTPAVAGNAPGVTAATNNRWFIEPTGTGVNGVWTYSIWVKTDVVNTQFGIYLNDKATDNVLASTVITTNGTWQRVSVTATAANATTPGIRAVIATSQAVQIQLPQIEPLPFATQNIPTSGAAVTRAADTFVMPFNLPTTQGSFYASYYDASGGNLTGRAWIASISDSGNNRLAMRSGDTGATDWPSMVVGDGVANATISPDPVFRVARKVAGAYGPTGFSQVANSLVATDPKVWVPAGPTTIILFDGGFCGYVYEYRQYTRKMSDAELQELTA